jgi:hypothetical protein
LGLALKKLRAVPGVKTVKRAPAKSRRSYTILLKRGTESRAVALAGQKAFRAHGIEGVFTWTALRSKPMGLLLGKKLKAYEKLHYGR